MSNLMKDMCTMPHIRTLQMSVYHLQMDVLVEHFNSMLKNRVRKVVSWDGKDWDTLLPYLMFTIRKVSQTSMGFSLFELLWSPPLQHSGHL